MKKGRVPGYVLTIFSSLLGNVYTLQNKYGNEVPAHVTPNRVSVTSFAQSFYFKCLSHRKPCKLVT